MYTGSAQSRAGRYQKTLERLRKHATPEKVAEYQRLRGDEEQHTRPQVLGCNWNTVKVFLLLSSDWQRGGMSGVFLGIPSPSIESTLRLAGITLSPDEFEDLKVMEAVAKPILNEALRAK